MPLLSNDMNDLDRPVTRRELREELEALLKTLAAKEDLKAFATKDDLKAYATKEDLKAFATKEDLKAYATKEDLKAYPTREEMNARFDELHTHFDVVAEAFRSDFNNLYDWTVANTNILTKRVRHVETGHGARLTSLEAHVTALKRRK